MFGDNNFFGGAAEADFYDHPIEQSLRFNDDDSAYLSWTPASAGNRKTWTFSCWVKRGKVGSRVNLFNGGTAGWNDHHISFESSDGLHWMNPNGSSGFAGRIETAAKYRDPSAWYHIVCTWDTTNATASERMRMYINGERYTGSWALESYPSQNQESHDVNDTQLHRIGKDNSYPHDGYLAEVHFIDGQALDASSFGEFKSGVWIPKAYSGSYGTNGFYLDFDGTYYNDKSGNGNNFTANNLAATDVVLDSPTNNFATLNPLVVGRSDGGGASWSAGEGNLKGANYNGSGGWAMMGTTYSIPEGSGKWYFECVVGATGQSMSVGIQKENTPFAAAYIVGWTGDANGYSYTNDGYKWNNGSTAYGSAASAGDIIGVAIDASGATTSITYYKNNTSMGTAFSGLTGSYMPALSSVSGSGNCTLNFGQDSSFAGNKTAQGNTDDNGYGDFYYAPPTGYLALCTANLEVPDAMNPALDNSPQDYFNTVLWSGDGTTTGVYISGVGFQPDLVWATGRNVATYPILTDVLRGNQKFLFSNATDAEFTSAKRIEDFQADGFNAEDDYYISGRTYVAWNWKANGSGVSNTDGSITSTVSANTDAGFSIVSYTGNGLSGQDIGHGLNSKPELIFKKNRSTAANWAVTTTIIDGSNDYAFLNLTNAFGNSGEDAPTSSVIPVYPNTENNSSGDNFICYAFHSVDGFSKIGKYTGNGSTDGTFCYCGFKPSFVMVKRTDAANNWVISDSARDIDNAVSAFVKAESSNAESSAAWVDFTANGFKLRNSGNGWNASGGTYIFMAFSESPFKYSTAR